MKDIIARIFKDEFEAKRQEGINKVNMRVATDMLRNGEPLDKIAKYSRLAEDSIRSLAKSLGVTVI